MLSDQESCRILIAALRQRAITTCVTQQKVDTTTLTVKAFNWFVSGNCLVTVYRRYRPRRRGHRCVELSQGRNRDSKIPEGKAWMEGPRSRGREGGLGGRDGGSLGGSPGMEGRGGKEGRGGTVMDISFSFWILMDSIAKFFGYPWIPSNRILDIHKS